MKNKVNNIRTSRNNVEDIIYLKCYDKFGYYNIIPNGFILPSVNTFIKNQQRQIQIITNILKN